MLKVECESCKAPYQVDERRVPQTGLKMRCPKCGHTFLVTDPSKGAARSSPTPDGGADALNLKQTMVGVGFSSAALPAVRAAPQAQAKATAPAVPRAASAAPQASPARAGAAAPRADADLPALVSDPGLPAVVARPAAPQVPAPPPVPSPFKLDMHRLDSIELPSPKVPGKAPAKFDDLPAPAPPRSPPGLDLPVPKGESGFGFGFDLPVSKDGGMADLPARSPDRRGQQDLPAMSRQDLPVSRTHHDLPVVGGNLPTVGGPGLPIRAPASSFGEIDLPSIQNDLPTSQNSLPSAQSSLPSLQNSFPSVQNALPSAQSGLPSLQNSYPSVQNALPAVQNSFPSVQNALPAVQNSLPSVQNSLPMAMSGQAHMPMSVPNERLLPSTMGAAPPPMAFGELDLPLVGGGSTNEPPEGGIGSFGELELPPDPSMQSGPLSQGQSGPGSGGMAFGEVDLGAGDSAAPSIAPPSPPRSAGSIFQEASLDGVRPPASARGHRVIDSGAPSRSTSRAPKVIAASVALLVVGGAALQFTPIGAFGYVAISDKLHAGEYERAALGAADAARAKLALDTFASAQQAADELAELKRRSPRSRALASYAAFVEYANQVRFGRDSARSARAKTFLSDIPATPPVAYMQAALAAQAASAGEWPAAKSALASAKEPKDGIQYDMTVLRGEIALAERDYTAALAAFTEAVRIAPNARSQYGLARVHYAMNDFGKAKAMLERTLASSPAHAGAHTLNAVLSWETRRDDVAALKELDSLLDDKARKIEGPSEVSAALAAKGWIVLALDRSGEARAVFDEAVKLDPRNVSALVGQGEVLYADGRYTEALTRFDEAVLKYPNSLPAVIGAAKTKIMLERLSDAKAQLTAARARVPRDMGVARWLATVEEALGNKVAAEKLYIDAIDLADPTNADAIDAYSAYASFLASQGRPAEAQAKLEEARKKLPDSASLQRAFGDVAVAQGQFDTAIGYYQQALERNANDLGTRFRLGVAFRKVKRLEEAAREFDTIVATDKDFPNIAVERGLLFEQSGDLKKALEQFQSALEKSPKDVDLQLRVGAAYVAIGETDKALPLLTKVKELRPNSAEANHFIGRAHLRRGSRDAVAAMRYLQRAVELDPNRAEYHLYVAWAANEAIPAQLGLARTEVDKALTLDKLLADAYWQRGVVSLRESAVNDAILDLKHALDLKPTRFEAHATLAEAYEQKNDMANAMNEWSRAIAADEKVPLWRYRFGRILLEKGNTAEAARHLAFAMEEGKKAEPRPGWLARAAFEAGEALRKTGQKSQALEAYQLYFDLAPPSDPDRRDATRGLQQVGGSRSQ